VDIKRELRLGTHGLNIHLALISCFWVFYGITKALYQANGGNG